MAKKSAVEKNNKRKRIVAARGARRAALKAIIADKNVAMEERFQAVLKLAQEPRDSAKIRIRNRILNIKTCQTLDFASSFLMRY